MIIENFSKKTILAKNVTIAGNIFQRLKGLLGTKSLSQNYALIIKPCSSVHTYFMQYNIDVAFVDKDNKIIAMVHDLAPFKISNIYFNSAFCIEFPSGTLKKTSTTIGDTIVLGQ